MVSFITCACPFINIKKPLTLKEQQASDFKYLRELLPTLDREFTIKEYSTLDEISDIQVWMDQLIQDYLTNKKLNGELVLKVLFDLIKRRLDFSGLLKALKKIDSNDKLTQLALFNYILHHADSQLKVFLCITCAYFIPIPLLSYNPWQNNENMKLQINSEILYIYEKSKSIIQFKLQSKQNSFLQQNTIEGCSTLLNQVFGRQFSLHEQNLVNFGQVEIQFDLNCADVEHLLVADTHGFLDLSTLKQIFPLFDGFIIHVSENLLKENQIQQDLDNLCKEIGEKNDQEKKILIIKHDSVNKNISTQFNDKSQNKNIKILEISTPNLQSLSQSNYQILISSIQEQLQNYLKIDNDSYKTNTNLRLQTKQIFLNVAKQVNQSQLIQHQEAYDQLYRIIDLIKNQENLKAPDFLPMINHITTLSKLQKIIEDEQNENQQAKIEAQNEKKRILKKIKIEQSTDISNLYLEIVTQNQCMKLLPSLSSIVKGFLESKLKYFFDQREEKREKLLNTDLKDKETLQNLEQDIRLLNQAIDEKWFSTELLSRELFYLGQNSKKSQIQIEDYHQLVKHFEQTAQPFELVDGDTLNFTQNVYQEVFQNYDQDELLVVCVLGPQSSGKSLLMNYLFGTSFLSSSGRCTKGVYASILKFRANDGKNKRILILDTEGIQSPEGRDTTFDKRIVYYAICISHVVLMCNKGEMNAPMSETVKLVADAIVNTQMPFLKNPSVYIILNMLANPNDKVQLECIEELKKELKNMQPSLLKKSDSVIDKNSIQVLNEVLKIDKESLITLGFAFNTSQFGSQQERTVNKPSPEFAMRVMKLRKKILSKFQEIENSRSTKYTLTDWFRHAQQFWTFSRDCRQLIQYQTLSQKRIDLEVLQQIEELIKENYVDIWQKSLKDEIINDVQNIFKQYSGGSSVKFESIHNRIQDIIDLKYKQIHDKIIEEYRTFCQNKAVASDLMKSREEILNRKRDEFKKDAKRFCNQKLTKFIEEKSKIVGDTILQEEIIRLLKIKDSYSKKEANKEFKSSWEKSINQIQNVIMKGDELTNRSKKSVISEFEHLLTTNPLNYDSYFNMAKSQHSQDQWQENILNKFQEVGLMFIGDTMAPNINKIVDLQLKNNRKFVINKKVQLFENKITYVYFQWWHALQSILNKELLVWKIYSKMTQKEQGFIDSIQFWKNEENFIKEGLKSILNPFKNECRQLGFSFELDEDHFILFLNTGKKKNSPDYIKNSIINAISKQENFKLIEIIDPFQDEKKYRSGQFISLNWRNKQNAFIYFRIITNEYNYYKVQDFTDQTTMNIDNRGYHFWHTYNKTKINKQILDTLMLQKKKIPPEGKKLPDAFEEYLNYLKDPNFSKPVSSTNRAGQEYFFNTIAWKNVFIEIEKSVIQNYRTNAEVQNDKMIKYYVDILSKNNQKSEDLAQDFNKMGPKVAKSIFKDVNEIIKQIDEEIEPFCMKISDKGKEFIFLVTQIFSFMLTEKLEIINESFPLRQYMNRKDREKKLFKAKLTQNDTQMDISLGEKLAEELCTYFYQECKFKTIRQFQTKMKDRQDAFKKVNFIKDLENQCVKIQEKLIANSSYQLTKEEQNSKKELIDYYLDPKRFLENKFQLKFKQVSEDFIEDCKQDFNQSYSEKVNSLIEYFCRLQDKLIETKTNKSSTVLFIPDSSKQQKQIDGLNSCDKQFLKLQKKAATTYLKQLLSNEWKSDSKINFEGLEFTSSADYILPLSSEIQNPQPQRFDQAYHDFIGDNFGKEDQISYMHKFIEAIIKFLNNNKDLQSYLNTQQGQPQEKQSDDQDEIRSFVTESDQSQNSDIENNSQFASDGEGSDYEKQIIQQRKQSSKKLKKQDFELIKYEELVGEYLQDFRSKFLGCYEACPLCRKQCDLPHEEKFNDQNVIHDCQLGHQFQGIGGNKDFYDDEAITYSCNNLKDDDDVLYKDKDKKWIELKNSVIKHWNFDKNLSAVLLARKSQVKIWNLLGREICQNYQLQGNKILFKPAQEELKPNNYGKVHYIMILDDSGSMNSQPWQQLISAYKEFLVTLENDRFQKENSKVTCILHDDTVRVSFQEKVPDSKLIDLLVPRFQENDFDMALNKAFQICSETHSKYQKLVLYFMSDGKWTFPQQSINNFEKDRSFKKKIIFYSVGFGAGSDKNLMERIADQMPNGQVVDAPTAQKLTESFKKVVIKSLYGEER